MEERSYSAEGDWMLCAVCGFPLIHDPSGRLGGPEWTHPGIRPSEDHVPVAVPSSEVASYNGRCDFCDSEAVTTIVLADDFVIAGDQASKGPWGACDPCAQLAIAREWNRLATRVRKSKPPAPERSHEVLMYLFRKLDEHVRGHITLEEWHRSGNYPLKAN